MKNLLTEAIAIVRKVGPAECGVHRLTVESSFVEFFKVARKMGMDVKGFNEAEFRKACR